MERLSDKDLYDEYLKRLISACHQFKQSGIFYTDEYINDVKKIDDMALVFCSSVEAMQIDEYYSQDRDGIRKVRPSNFDHCKSIFIYPEVYKFMQMLWVTLKYEKINYDRKQNKFRASRKENQK